jgi:hypothetical protein
MRISRRSGRVLETEHQTSAEPNFRNRNFLPRDVLDVWWPTDAEHFVSWVTKFENSEIIICSPFRLTAQADLATIASRVFTAEFGALINQ